MPNLALIKNGLVQHVIKAPNGFNAAKVGVFDAVIDVTALDQNALPEKGDKHNGGTNFQSNNHGKNAAAKLKALGLNDQEVQALLGK